MTSVLELKQYSINISNDRQMYLDYTGFKIALSAKQQFLFDNYKQN